VIGFCKNGHNLELPGAFVNLYVASGKKPHKKYLVRRCKQCMQKAQTKHYKKRIAEGKCWCGRIKDQGKTSCNFCIRKRPRLAKAWYEKHKAEVLAKQKLRRRRAA
jgi:hypothetical protein